MAGSADERAVFASIQRPQAMAAWLGEQREQAVSAMVKATDMVGIHRMQGRIQLIDHMIALLRAEQTR